MRHLDELVLTKDEAPQETWEFQDLLRLFSPQLLMAAIFLAALIARWRIYGFLN